MNKRMRGRTRAADHRKTHLGAMLLFMLTLAALIAAALIRPAMRTDKPDGDELTNIEIVLDHVDADEGVSRRVLLELMKADTDKKHGNRPIRRRADRAYLPYAYYGSILPHQVLYLRRLLPLAHEGQRHERCSRGRKAMHSA